MIIGVSAPELKKNAKKLQASFPQLRAQNATTVTINSIHGDFPGWPD